MRGDTNTENEVEADEHGGSASAPESASAERRSSIATLQNVLKKVSQSPFHSQYQTLVSSTSDSSGLSVNESQSKQDGEFLMDLSAAADNHQLHQGQNGEQEQLHLNSQNGVSRGLARMNPFYTYYLESNGKGDAMENIERKSIFAPPPAFQSSPVDLQSEMETVEFSAPKDLLQGRTSKPMQDRSETPAQITSVNGHFHDVTLNSPDLFKQVHAKSTKEVNVFEKSPSNFGNPFKSPSNKDDVFQSPQPLMANPLDSALFQAVPSKSGELFPTMKNKQDPSTTEDLSGTSFSKQNLDVFSSSSTNTIDPFPSPVARDLFQDVSSLDDPFGASPTGQYNPFHVSPGTPDIFQSLPSKTNSRDIFGTTPRSTASKALYSTPLLNNPSEVKQDTPSSPDLFKETASESRPAIQPESSDKPHDIFLTTPQGTKQDILQPSPFTRARNLSMLPSQSPSEMNHVPTFKRPPKPLPRTRPPRPEKPPNPEKPPKPERPPPPAIPIQPEPTVPKTSPKPAFRQLPKPIIPRKPKVPQSKPVEPENYVVFEDILLIGQERCVEDWPEDSPEFSPNFKPSGTFRLRRESLKMKADSDGGSGEDQDGSGISGKKRDIKSRFSLISRRGSKEKFADDAKERRSSTLPATRKSSKEYFPDQHMSAEENEDGDQNWIDYKKKHLKTKVNQLLRRASTASSVSEAKNMNGHLPQDDDIDKKSNGKRNSVIRRWSEGTVLDDSSGEDEEGGEAQHEEVDSHGTKKKKKVKIKFVPQRGFAITVDKGAHGHTPRKSSKEKSQDEILGAHGYTPRKKSQGDAYEDVEDTGLHSASKAAFMDDEHLQKTSHMSAALNGDEDPYGMEACKRKKPTKKKLLHMVRRSSKEDMLDDTSHQKKKNSLSAEELDDEDCMEDGKLKTSKHKGPLPIPRKSKTANEATGFSQHIPQHASNDAFGEDDFTQTGKDFMSPGEAYDSEEDDLETCKPKKTSKLKVLKKLKAKRKAMHQGCEDPPGASSSDYMSEAAKAEWQAAQMDERALAGLEDEGEDGDTDSLMEWWNTVEQWDEVPSDEEDKVLKEDESKSFTILADKVSRGLRVYNKVFTERAEVLWQSVITLHAIADDINNFHHKARIAGITGGTTTAVGGVTAIAGLALAPFTFGASLVITAVGVGVATAGGITSASAAISDNVNNMQDRKKVELVLDDYEADLKAIGKILHFVNQGLYKLRGHPFLRSGTQHYSEDWEVRKAVQMISLVDSPVMRGTEITDSAIASVQGLFKGMDKYFVKESRELRKGCKKEVVAQIKEVANVLNDVIVELNAIREELQDATGNM